MSFSQKFGVKPGSIRKKSMFGIIAGAVIVIAVAIFITYLIIDSNKPPVYTIDDTTFKISAQFGETISLADISNIETSNNFPGNLIKTNGAAIGNIFRGNFQSNGTNMKIYADASKPPFIYIYTKNGQIIINDQSTEKTQALYQELQNKLRH